MSAAKQFNWQRAERERAQGRPAIVERVRSLIAAANSVRSRTLEQQYRRSAENLMARNGITEAEL